MYRSEKTTITRLGGGLVAKTVANPEVYARELQNSRRCRDVAYALQLHDAHPAKRQLIFPYYPHTLEHVLASESAEAREAHRRFARSWIEQIRRFVADVQTKHGLYHNDLKAKNVLLSGDYGEVRVCDFEDMRVGVGGRLDQLVKQIEKKWSFVALWQFLELHALFDAQSEAETMQEYNEQFDEFYDHWQRKLGRDFNTERGIQQVENTKRN